MLNAISNTYLNTKTNVYPSFQNNQKFKISEENNNVKVTEQKEYNASNIWHINFRANYAIRNLESVKAYNKSLVKDLY